jgi:hypothetical protein
VPQQPLVVATRRVTHQQVGEALDARRLIAPVALERLAQRALERLGQHVPIAPVRARLLLRFELAHGEVAEACEAQRRLAPADELFERRANLAAVGELEQSEGVGRVEQLLALGREALGERAEIVPRSWLGSSRIS